MRDLVEIQHEQGDSFRRSRLPTWREMNIDTSPEAEAVLLRLWREMPGWRKLALMEDMNRTVRKLALIGLRGRYQNATEEELQRLLATILPGEELASTVYGPIPE